MGIRETGCVDIGSSVNYSELQKAMSVTAGSRRGGVGRGGSMPRDSGTAEEAGFKPAPTEEAACA